jgi:hypothetical protein
MFRQIYKHLSPCPLHEAYYFQLALAHPRIPGCIRLLLPRQTLVLVQLTEDQFPGSNRIIRKKLWVRSHVCTYSWLINWHIWLIVWQTGLGVKTFGTSTNIRTWRIILLVCCEDISDRWKVVLPGQSRRTWNGRRQWRRGGRRGKAVERRPSRDVNR